MYSFSKIPLQQDAVQRIVDVHFNGCHIQKFEELTEGFFNAAALIDLDNGQKLVLKAAPPAEVQVLRYEKDLMRAEVESMRLVRERSAVPVPEIYVYDDSHSLLQSDYFIMECLKGAPLHKIRAEIPAEKQVEIEREVGRMVREMSEISNPAFGYWTQPQQPGVLWRACFDQMIRGVLQDGMDAGVKLALPYEEVYAQIAAHYDALEEVTTPGLVHWDLWDGNIFVDPQTYQVTGLIDFERVLWAEKSMEVCFAGFGPVDHYLEGVGKDLFITRNEQRRRMLYNAYLWLIMIIECTYRKYDNPWQENFARQKIDEELAKLASV